MSDQPVFDRIREQFTGDDVVLYMKGTPVFPQCGFSARVVQILSHVGVPFKGVNVLEDETIRQGIKAYSNWPTIPQLYVKGEFVGGCDIAREMFQAGSDPNPPIDVGDGFLMRRGWVVASCGWQGDLPDLPGLFRLHGVEARHVVCASATALTMSLPPPFTAFSSVSSCASQTASSRAAQAFALS